MLKIVELVNLLGINPGHHIIMHGSWRRIRQILSELSPDQWIEALQYQVGENGSLVIPAFTYCFKRSQGKYEIFEKEWSSTKIGAMADFFWRRKDVTRTASPTHSFGIWGAICHDIDPSNSPESPLGKGSVLDWLAHQANSHVLMAGTDFSSLSFGHYLEITAPLPWCNYSPWDYMHVLPIGVSVSGEQPLCQIPGCSKGFMTLQREMLRMDMIRPVIIRGIELFYFPVKILMDFGIVFFRHHASQLLCTAGMCPSCDARRVRFNLLPCSNTFQ